MSEVFSPRHSFHQIFMKGPPLWLLVSSDINSKKIPLCFIFFWFTLFICFYPTSLWKNNFSCFTTGMTKNYFFPFYRFPVRYKNHYFNYCKILPLFFLRFPFSLFLSIYLSIYRITQKIYFLLCLKFIISYEI